jgi:F-type H+-transporting ATPase subunit epsilon
MDCDIVSASENIYSGKISLLVVTGASGELGITPRHAPLITTLKAGAVRVIDEAGEESTFFIGGGILEVMPHLVTVLADTAIRADDFDEAEAIRARREAERQLATRSSELDIVEAQRRLIEAMEQLKAAQRWRRRLKGKR